MAWFGLALTLVWNYLTHRRRLLTCPEGCVHPWHATICSAGRRLLPRAVFIAGWAAFNSWFIPHVLRGYPRLPKESR